MPKGIFCLPSQKGEKALCWDWRNKGKKEGGGNKGREETRKANRPLREQAEKQTRPLFSSWHSKEVVFHWGGLVSLFVCQSTVSVFLPKLIIFCLNEIETGTNRETLLSCLLSQTIHIDTHINCMAALNDCWKRNRVGLQFSATFWIPERRINAEAFQCTMRFQYH